MGLFKYVPKKVGMLPNKNEKKRINNEKYLVIGIEVIINSD